MIQQNIIGPCNHVKIVGNHFWYNWQYILNSFFVAWPVWLHIHSHSSVERSQQCQQLSLFLGTETNRERLLN